MNWEEHKLQTQLKTDRATIVPSMSKRSSGRTKRRGKRSRSKGKKTVRVVKGRVAIRVPGYQGVQKFSPSHLIQHVNKKNLRQAAKTVLNRTKKGGKGIKKRSRKRHRKSKK